MNIVEAMGGVVMFNLYMALILISCLCTAWAALSYIFTKENRKAEQGMKRTVENLKTELDLLEVDLKCFLS